MLQQLTLVVLLLDIFGVLAHAVDVKESTIVEDEAYIGDIVLQDTGARRSGSLTVLNAHGDFCAGQKEATEHAPPGYWCRSPQK